MSARGLYSRARSTGSGSASAASRAASRTASASKRRSNALSLPASLLRKHGASRQRFRDQAAREPCRRVCRVERGRGAPAGDRRREGRPERLRQPGPVEEGRERGPAAVVQKPCGSARGQLGQLGEGGFDENRAARQERPQEQGRRELAGAAQMRDEPLDLRRRGARGEREGGPVAQVADGALGPAGARPGRTAARIAHHQRVTKVEGQVRAAQQGRPEAGIGAVPLDHARQAAPGDLRAGIGGERRQGAGDRRSRQGRRRLRRKRKAGGR